MDLTPSASPITHPAVSMASGCPRPSQGESLLEKKGNTEKTLLWKAATSLELSSVSPPSSLLLLPSGSSLTWPGRSRDPLPSRTAASSKWPRKQIQPGLGWAGSERPVPRLRLTGMLPPNMAASPGLRNRGQLSHCPACLPRRVRNFLSPSPKCLSAISFPPVLLIPALLP